MPITLLEAKNASTKKTASMARFERRLEWQMMQIHYKVNTIAERRGQK